MKPDLSDYEELLRETSKKIKGVNLLHLTCRPNCLYRDACNEYERIYGTVKHDDLCIKDMYYIITNINSTQGKALLDKARRYADYF